MMQSAGSSGSTGLAGGGMGTMRVGVITAPGTVELAEVPIPEPGPGEVLLRLEGSGVCASNLSVWAGQPWFNYPLDPGAPGHEGWGRIVATGAEVQEVSVGDRVAALSSRAYAEYDVVPATAVVLLPSELEGVPVPGEPLGCAFNIFARSRIEPGDTVAIVGAGFLGVLLTRLATSIGAQVLALSRREYALDVARGFGAVETIPLDDHYRVIETVRDLTDGVFCDRVIECTGHQWPLDLSAELTRERGTLVIAGYHQDGPRQVNMQLWNWRGLDVINAHERDPGAYLRGMRAAVNAMVSGTIDPQSLFTHRFPLDRLGDAFDATRERPDGFMKAIVEMA